MPQRNTRQRTAIRMVFDETDRPLSTQEVLTAAQAHEQGLGIATVYRTLNLLLREQWLTTVKLPGESPRYERAGKPHHHHFHCGECGRVFEVPGNDALLDSLVPTGFVVADHDLVLHGRCADCSGNTAAAD